VISYSFVRAKAFAAVNCIYAENSWYNKWSGTHIASWCVRKDLHARMKTCECGADWVNLIRLSCVEQEDIGKRGSNTLHSTEHNEDAVTFTVAFIKHFSIIIILPPEIFPQENTIELNLYSNKQVNNFRHNNKQKMRGKFLLRKKH
jgi:hypothetical protein